MAKVHWGEKRGYFCQQRTLNWVLTINIQIMNNWYDQKTFQRGIITVTRFLPFPVHSLWVCLVQLPLSAFSAIFFCAIKHISCLQGFLLGDISNSYSFIWAHSDCLSTQNSEFKSEKRDSFCFDHMLWKVWQCIWTPSPSPNRNDHVYHSLRVWIKMVS